MTCALTSSPDERADDEDGVAFHAGNALTLVGQGLDGDDEIVGFLQREGAFSVPYLWYPFGACARTIF